MKNICFIGAFEKIDLILYVAKILRYLNQKILIIDATRLQKSRYIIPNVTPTRLYITTFEDIDIAIGFGCYQDIEKYIGITELKMMNYDYILINIDNYNVFANFNNEDTIKNYFVTSFDTYFIKRGIETIQGIEKPINVKKIIFSNNVSEDDEQYLDYLSMGYRVTWEDTKIVFPYITEDMEAISDNQKTFKIKLKGLSQLYKNSLENLMLDIIPEAGTNNIRKIIKNIEKEG